MLTIRADILKEKPKKEEAPKTEDGVEVKVEAENKESIKVSE